MKLKSFLKIWNPFYNRKPRTKYKKFSFDSFERELEREKIYKAKYYLEEIIYFLTQYPFNKHGYTNFIWWFKYRLFKEHQYHKIDLGLKPGYYELGDIFEKALMSKRTIQRIQDLKEYIDKVTIQAPEQDMEQFKKAFYYLDKSRNWFINKKPKAVERLELYLFKKESKSFEYYLSRESWINKLDKKYLKLIIEYKEYLST